MHRSLFALCLLMTGCTLHSRADEMHGVMGIRGEPVEYQITTNVALNGLFVFDLIGDASKTATVDLFMEEANNRGASRARITQTDSFTYWFIFPPISFFIHPVVTTVEGDVEGVILEEED